jgi:SAM-dependent methyltransferase
MRTWGDFYAGDVDLATFFSTLSHHAPFMEAILAARPERALEAGCGTAVMSSFLGMAGVDAIAVDNDARVLDVARASAARWPAAPRFVEHDIFKLAELGLEADVVFSQGVLEHFGDEEIVRLARESLTVAPRFVFSVPSRWYGHRDFGNERLLGAPEWGAILEPAGDVRVTPYFFARRRGTKLLRRPLMLMATVTRSGAARSVAAEPSGPPGV